jgi:hypothetical protein
MGLLPEQYARVDAAEHQTLQHQFNTIALKPT